MSEKKIVSVGCQVPGSNSTFISIDSDKSLFDYDIVLFCPNIYPLLGNPNSYQGKPWLSDHYSFQLKNRLTHWQREIRDALHSSKTVIVFLTKFYDVFIDTGGREYSGTGRNRQTTQILTPYDNYKCLPVDLNLINDKGSEVKLTSGSEILSSYWSEFKEYSSYEVLLEVKVSKPLIVTRTGEKVLGALVRLKESSGALLILPYLNLDADEFTKENNKGELIWTKEGKQFGARLINSIIEIDKTIRASNSVSPAPDWVNSSEYDLAGEVVTRGELLKIGKKLDDLQQQKQKLESRLVDEGMLKKLLFEKGHPLEDAILSALKVIGFSANKYRNGESEFDAVFESPEGRFLGEAEGRDNSAVGIDKLCQLEMNIHEDLTRDEISEPAKGVLFGNAYRLIPLSDRGDFFTEKCKSAAKRSGTALIATPDLFVIAQYLIGEPNENFSKECRRVILETSGETVKFPKPPILAMEKTDVKELEEKNDEDAQTNIVSNQ